MDLAQKVGEMLTKPVAQPRAQSEQVEKASRLLSDLQSRGLVGAPAYKLSPMNSVPPKTAAFAKI